ncbi:MAG: O-antigen ligase family protein [Gammaproteobacteria bacterium]
MLLKHPVIIWLQTNYSWLLVIAVLPLFWENALYNIPLLLLAALACYRLTTGHRDQFLQPPLVLFVIAFLALWLPQLIALVDAYHFSASAKKALPYIGYGLAGFYIATYINRSDLDKILTGIAVVVLVWCIDALLALAGIWSIFGYSPKPGMVMGIFFQKQSIGHICAALFPVVLEVLRRRHWHGLWLMLVALVIVTIVLLSGRRVAWMMLAFAASGYVVYLWLVVGLLRWRRLIVISVLLATTIAVLHNSYSPFASRFNQALGLFSGDAELVAAATSQRTDIWRTGVTIFQDRWLNGIGPRAFRHAYMDYADTNDYWRLRQTAPTQPHLHILEIAVGTGVTGLAGYLVFLLCLWKGLRNRQAGYHWVLGLAVITAVLPVNAHLAFYGSYWSAFLWWLTGLMYAAIRIHHPPAQDDSTSGQST